MSSTGQGTDIARTIGANIRLARTDARLKQRELGARLSIAAQQISDWERGDYRPNDNNLTRLSDALAKDFSWFFVDHHREKSAA